MNGPIGVFDSGFGGLSVLADLQRALPQADFLYLGDNARAPYGTRSFDAVYRFTLQAVEWLFAQGCPLVILACNTASAKALRNIQQRDLPRLDPNRRVLGVIRPTAEAVGALSRTGVVGVLGTPGTVASGSYDIEIAKLHPGFRVVAEAAPMWVPIVEQGFADSDGADWFVREAVDRTIRCSTARYAQQCPGISPSYARGLLLPTAFSTICGAIPPWTPPSAGAASPATAPPTMLRASRASPAYSSAAPSRPKQYR